MPSEPVAANGAQAKQSSQLNRGAFGALKMSTNKPDVKVMKAGVMDDATETKRKLEKLEDMPAVDMTMPAGAASVGDLEVDDDDDDDEANKIDEEKKVQPKDAMEVDDDDEVDPLDAFMSEVKEEVQKVDASDMEKMLKDPSYRRRLEDRMDEDGVPEEDVQAAPDELDATDLNPEDILALAAKKAKKKELASVDHAKISYEPFRKEFYHPPPEVEEMTDEDAENLRLALDGIKIRGQDCPRPITKWSHCGLPASVYV